MVRAFPCTARKVKSIKKIIKILYLPSKSRSSRLRAYDEQRRVIINNQYHDMHEITRGIGQEVPISHQEATTIIVLRPIHYCPAVTIDRRQSPCGAASQPLSLLSLCVKINWIKQRERINNRVIYCQGQST